MFFKSYRQNFKTVNVVDTSCTKNSYFQNNLTQTIRLHEVYFVSQKYLGMNHTWSLILDPLEEITKP